MLKYNLKLHINSYSYFMNFGRKSCKLGFSIMMQLFIIVKLKTIAYFQRVVKDSQVQLHFYWVSTLNIP